MANDDGAHYHQSWKDRLSAFEQQFDAQSSSFIAQLAAQNENLAAQDAIIAELQARIAEQESKIRQLMKCRKMYFNVRERCWLGFLRDSCVGEGEKHKNRIRLLNSAFVHGGDVTSDARMLCERRPAEENHAFESLYGLQPQEILGLQEAGGRKVLLLLNFVGDTRLQAKWIFNQADDESLREIVRLVGENRLEEAGDLAEAFPVEQKIEITRHALPSRNWGLGQMPLY
ncbi:hypothetical protein N7539_001915 [Penicillium diatomitis]|uniref:Uncharacterized protein n=1 Tax=Penicillium diatomitis TaxID=2819901 RepID=A0A9W9XHU8_9EURO|nr:uncharacterized protein N7539_001915 [Penicillium diatomitis]KAJ5493169.1 hypothetical protein N7539_001915 [Penicillium diatomitis]